MQPPVDSMTLAHRSGPAPQHAARDTRQIQTCAADRRSQLTRRCLADAGNTDAAWQRVFPARFSHQALQCHALRCYAAGAQTGCHTLEHAPIHLNRAARDVQLGPVGFNSWTLDAPPGKDVQTDSQTRPYGCAAKSRWSWRVWRFVQPNHPLPRQQHVVNCAAQWQCH